MTDEEKKAPETGAEETSEKPPAETQGAETVKPAEAKLEKPPAETQGAETVKPAEAKLEKPQEETQGAETVKPAEAKKEEVAKKAPPPPPKKEKPEKCEHCAKLLSRIKWYYRNGGYYCNKRCWKEFKKKQEAEANA